MELWGSELTRAAPSSKLLIAPLSVTDVRKRVTLYTNCEWLHPLGVKMDMLQRLGLTTCQMSFAITWKPTSPC